MIEGALVFCGSDRIARLRTPENFLDMLHGFHMSSDRYAVSKRGAQRFITEHLAYGTARKYSFDRADGNFLPGFREVLNNGCLGSATVAEVVLVDGVGLLGEVAAGNGEWG